MNIEKLNLRDRRRQAVQSAIAHFDKVQFWADKQKAKRRPWKQRDFDTIFGEERYETAAQAAWRTLREGAKKIARDTRKEKALKKRNDAIEQATQKAIASAKECIDIAAYYESSSDPFATFAAQPTLENCQKAKIAAVTLSAKILAKKDAWAWKVFWMVVGAIISALTGATIVAKMLGK